MKRRRATIGTQFFESKSKVRQLEMRLHMRAVVVLSRSRRMLYSFHTHEEEKLYAQIVLKQTDKVKRSTRERLYTRKKLSEAAVPAGPGHPATFATIKRAQYTMEVWEHYLRSASEWTDMAPDKPHKKGVKEKM